MKRLSIVLLVFFILTSIITYPLIFKVNTCIPGNFITSEPYNMIWEAWRMKFCFLNDLQLDKFIAYPFGMSSVKAIDYSIGLSIVKWLTIITNEIFTYNLFLLLSFLLSAVFVYYLVRYLTNNIYSAFFAGIIFSFCPYHIARSWQHWGLAQIQWMPLFLLALIKLKEHKTLKGVLFVFFSFFLGALDYTHVYLMLVFTFVFVMYVLINRKEKQKGKFFVLILVAGLLIFLATLPFTYIVYKNIIFGPPKEAMDFYYRDFGDLFTYSAKPLSYLLPPTFHPLFGGFTRRFVNSPLWGVNLIEHQLYLGWTVIILAFIAFRKLKRKKIQKVIKSPGSIEAQSNEYFYVGFFVCLAIVAWLFSQPPYWNFRFFKIYLPSFFMHKLLPMFRAYSRFGIVLILALVTLAGYGLKYILEKFKTQKAKIVLTCLFSCLLLFEFWIWPPFKVIDVSKVPKAYYWLKEQPGNFAIAEYPLDVDDGPDFRYLFHQTHHHKPIINATPPRSYAKEISKTLVNLSEKKTVSVLSWLGVKYVLVHRENYLQSQLLEWIEEYKKISRNPGLKFIRSFPTQECSTDIMCTQKTGQIDVYLVVASPKLPKDDTYENIEAHIKY